MPTRRILPPYRGVSTSTPYYDTPGDMCPVQSMRNVRCFVPSDDRPQIGQRPGLALRFPQRMGNGAPVQAMESITKAATVSGYVLGSCTPITDNWESRTAGTLLGQVWLLRHNLGMYREHYENVGASGPYSDTCTTDPSTQAVTCICVTPDGSRAIFGSTYVDETGATDYTRVRITCIRMSDGVRQWSRKLGIVTGFHSFVNTVAATNQYVFACVNQQVVITNVVTGEPGGAENLNMWSSEAIDVKATADGLYLYVMFYGATSAATLPGGETLSSGKYAAHIRAGVMKFQINTTGSVLSQVRFGAGLEAGDDYFEADHGYLRFSESLGLVNGVPRGRYPSALAVTPDGGIVCTHTNRGWGPTAAHVPAGALANVTAYDEDGALLWAGDTAPNYATTGDGSTINDICEFNAGGPSVDPLTTGTLFPMAAAVAVGADGSVFVGGRRTTGSGTEAGVFKLSGVDGRILDRYDLGHSLGQTVRQAAMCIDPLDGGVWVAGDRSTTWVGSPSSAPAHLWKLAAADLSVAGYFDLASAAKSGLGVAVDLNGQIAYCTDKV